MRRGNSDKALFVSDDGVFSGVALGWDFTAEHEWGIKGLTRDFGLREVARGGKLSKLLGKDVVGIEARQIQVIPESLKLITKGKGKDKVAYLISTRFYGGIDLKDYSKKELDRIVDASSYSDQELQCAWDEGSFGIRVTGDENRGYLEELFAAFNAEDVIITFGSKNLNNPFSGSGLMLLIASKLPQSYIDEQHDADIDHLDLVDAVKKTGIAKRLKNADLRYFALSPKWNGHIKSTKDGYVETKHPVIFFLNPMEQQENNVGWYTVEDLDEWIAGAGKIPKEAD